ncbi:hypothetical protein D0Q02_00965 [Micromonospora craniellae]|uniref:Uncharacterized protein n=1 Tax=Micromonospora craniellae TaxID=2294034 RepID=A0A372G5V3_9ACTN|nr:hypothetical protein D0Q02_00965 [Micromonospora craniellae]
MPALVVTGVDPVDAGGRPAADPAGRAGRVIVRGCQVCARQGAARPVEVRFPGAAVGRADCRRGGYRSRADGDLLAHARATWIAVWDDRRSGRTWG